MKKLMEMANTAATAVQSAASYVGSSAYTTAQYTSAKATEAGSMIYEVASNSVVYLTDINGDGKIDIEDFKAAMEKAGYVWNNFDEDAKVAIGTGLAAYAGASTIPLIGSAINGPSFVSITVITYVQRKAAKLKGNN